MPTPDQLRAIHALRRAAKLVDEDYRGILRQLADVDSAKDLDPAAAGRVIEHLKGLSGQRDDALKGAAQGSLRILGPWAGKMRALWITAYNLGVVADRTDKALAGWVARQTGIDHPSWVADPADAAGVVEGLKAWISRDAGLDWPPQKAPPIAVKRAVVRRQWARLIEAGNPVWHSPETDLVDYCAAVTRGNKRGAANLEALSEVELDRAAFAIGAKLRRQLAGPTKRVVR